VKLPAYATAIRETLRELVASRPELVLLSTGDEAENGLPVHHGEGVAGVLGAALGLALFGRPSIVTLAPSAAALAAMERWFHTPPAPPEGRLPITVRVLLDPAGPPIGQFATLPGLRVVAPATPAHAIGSLQEAVASPRPTLFLEDRRLAACREPGSWMTHSLRSRVPPPGSGCDREEAGAGGQDPREAPTDLTVVAISTMTRAAFQAAETLARHGIHVEVIEPPAVAPLATESVVRSIWRTHRGLVVDEGETPLGPVLAAAITEAAFDELDAPVEVVRVPQGVPTLPEAIAIGATAIARHALWLLGLPADAPVVEA
jgi:hypothetical protein